MCLLLSKHTIMVTLTVLITITTAQYFGPLTHGDFVLWEMRNRGTVWPKPAIEHRQPYFYVYAGNIFSPFTYANTGCPVINKAEERFIKHMATLYSYTYPYACISTHMNKGNLRTLRVHWSNPCNKYPFYDMDESYHLIIRHDITLVAVSVWGIIRGLETLKQLFFLRDGLLVIHENEIRDYPKYKHRGLMIDTARHYIPPSEIFMMLDAMAMNKMNVFHWHIVDDQSFPYVSKTFPELSQKGSFYFDRVYNTSTIREIVNYAAVRGIRVIPEFPIPGHVKSIIYSFPELFIKCSLLSLDEPYLLVGPISPIRKFTNWFLHLLFTDIADDFPDQFIHLGFHDIREDCWFADEQVQEYLRYLPETLQDEYTLIYNLFSMISNSWEAINEQNKSPKTKFIIWEEVFVKYNYEFRSIQENLRREIVIQLRYWLFEDQTLHTTMSKRNRTIEAETFYGQLYSSSDYSSSDETKQDPPYQRLTTHNFSIIYSFYLQMLKPENFQNDFELMYLHGKKLSYFPKAIGGEAYLWGSEVDDLNLATTVWPLASAVAEVLWNPEAINDVEHRICKVTETETKTNTTNQENGGPEEKECQVYRNFAHSVNGRLEEHICRMMRLGINSSPGRAMCEVLLPPTTVTQTTTTTTEKYK